MPDRKPQANRKPEVPCSVPPPEVTGWGRVPPHRQVADWLEARIKNGDFNGDVPLPSEFQLFEQFGIARDTARKVFKYLREELGLIETVGGRGSYALQDWHRGKPRQQG